MKKFIFFLICLMSFNVNAMTFDRVQMIYKKILKANHVWIAPRLKLVDVIYTKDKDGNTIASRINAETGAPWQYINITKDMVAKFNDDQIAFVLSHELGHFKRLDMGSNYNAEYGADQYGKKYSIKAGYNYCAGAMWLKGRGGSTTHPAGNDRLKAIGCL